MTETVSFRKKRIMEVLTNAAAVYEEIRDNWDLKKWQADKSKVYWPDTEEEYELLMITINSIR
ncbi:MAG: hypothetical protein KAR20_00505 [Candidatus Heimdallarchaeota archaeon]|nr:hypothetical protein [Candidatus Heimdallarchaeota archaeon]